MRKAMTTVAIAATVLSCSLALSASSPSVESKSGEPAAAKAEAAPLALRVLRGPLGFALRLTQALGLWTAPAAAESYGSQTIIDEPDPAGFSKDPKADPGEDEPAQHQGDAYGDGANVGNTPVTGMTG